MTGKGHAAFGSIAAADCVAGAIAIRLGRPDEPGTFYNMLAAATDFFDPMAEFGGLAGALLAGAAVILYYIGLLLPDIDCESTISNALRFRLNIRHRGFTHSLWAAGLFLVPSMIWRQAWILRFVAAGMACHGLADSLSPCGWVPFYPFGKYRVAHKRVVCSRRAHPRLYSSDIEGSEERVNIAFGIISAACAAGIVIGRLAS